MSKKQTDKQACPKLTLSTDSLRNAFNWHLRYSLAKDRYTATDRDRYVALASTVRDYMVERWILTQQRHHRNDVKRVYYLSLEFLMGRLLANNVINMRMEQHCSEALSELNMDWETLCAYEADAGLGNGGLGRLAACFLDSLATMNLPAIGYGLRYDYGIFKQRIQDGAQVEEPDHWLDQGYVWEIARPECACEVNFEGRVEATTINGGVHWRWVDTYSVKGVPHDVPVVGYGGESVNTLRLWQAQATDAFDLADFNRGSYIEAVTNKVLAENLTKVLYPNDNVQQGKELRLRQQYFFVSCSIQDILRRFRADGLPFTRLPERIFIQLNDTHPALVIPELMRILLDREMLGWDQAWEITQACTGYTNHTVLPEALEQWGVDLMERLLPRHMQIIYEINGRFLSEIAARHPGDVKRLQRMSIIDESNGKQVRMANLAIIGSCSVNGVSALHSHILRTRIFPDFDEHYPGKFNNKTNGVTQRRWLLKSNPALAELITERIGDGWIRNLDELRGLEKYLDDPETLDRFRRIKQDNKVLLADIIRDTLHISVNTDSLFDVQVKRLHEYKRQLLLALYIIVLYNRILANPSIDMQPRTFIFGAKAAPGYNMAKLIIRLIHGIASVVNPHPIVGRLIKVIFIPDYNVSLAERIIPAANVSEQISLAGTEASGTGNMKFMLNGALTVGTLDGANVEIAEAVGNDNIFIFGMVAEEVAERRMTYSPYDVYNSDEEIRLAVDRIRQNVFSLLEPGLFDPIIRSLLDHGDFYMLLADLRSYITTQDAVSQLYRDPRAWDRKALLNVARGGRFSSDRTIAEYASDIWKIVPSLPE
ncbi:MAG: glycogen/starch/alpha-glucan phosphorylase [Lentisphaerae bacterium]|jgi:starch phosphorylase|nr:glycogen/starch/alpha-glucan phosphorylase [Lentisphaerota bacterium]